MALRLFFHEAKPRQQLPYDLDHEMQDVRQKGEEVKEVSIGLDGDWFLRTSSRHGMSPPMYRPLHPSPHVGLKHEILPQCAKQNTVVRTWFQTSCYSRTSSNKRPVSVSHTT